MRSEARRGDGVPQEDQKKLGGVEFVAEVITRGDKLKDPETMQMSELEEAYFTLMNTNKDEQEPSGVQYNEEQWGRIREYLQKLVDHLVDIFYTMYYKTDLEHGNGSPYTGEEKAERLRQFGDLRSLIQEVDSPDACAEWLKDVESYLGGGEIPESFKGLFLKPLARITDVKSMRTLAARVIQKDLEIRIADLQPRTGE